MREGRTKRSVELTRASSHESVFHFSIKLFCRAFLWSLSQSFKLQLDLNVVIDH
jgi:hypothetical protein